jgi:hypothetical protein
MVDLVRDLLSGGRIAGKRVCLMGTRFTVSEGTYQRLLLDEGAREVVPLATTLTERAVAHLEHESASSTRAIAGEIGEAIRRSDAVLLACTCFPLVGEQIRTVNPQCDLLDPSSSLRVLPPLGSGHGPNRLTLRSSGPPPPLEEIEGQIPALFRGWQVESVEAVPNSAG